MRFALAAEAAKSLALLLENHGTGAIPAPLAALQTALTAAPEELPAALNRFALLPDAVSAAAGALLEVLLASGTAPAELLTGPTTPDTEFLLGHAVAALKAAALLPENVPPELAAYVRPGAAAAVKTLAELGEKEALLQAMKAADPFAAKRVFSCRKGEFRPVEPDSVKPVDHFYGFAGVRIAIAEQFAAFAAGKENLTMLINSLPGYGKTSMVLSYALDQPDLTIILAEPTAFNAGEWEELTEPLSRRTDHKFVVFFDDIDPRQVDWYRFRTNVGGAFTLPDNIMMVITANYEFPPSILSRGRKISYPVFDELRCAEMVEDFLRSFGMRKVPESFVSLIGADYTEEFSQKKFTELSPRTLMRYLKNYETDQRKRRRIVDLAGNRMITRPDAELFYAFNIELMRSLYGEEYIQKLLKERLKEL